MDKERLWTKDFVTVSVINFLIYFIFFSLMATIAAYAIDKFNASISTAGLGASIFIIGAVIGRLGTGRIIEDQGNKRVLIVGTILLIITSVLYFAAVTLPLLVIIRVLHGLAYGIASTAVGTIVAKIIPHRRRGEGISYFSASVVLATALGPFAGIFLIQHADFKIIFYITSILATVSFALSLAVSEPASPSPGQDQASAVKGFTLSNVFEFKALRVSTMAFIMGFCYSGILIFMSLYSKQIHLVEAASLFFPVFAVTTLVSRPSSGRLLDARGAKVVYPCLVIFIMGMLLLSQARHGIILLLAAAVIGLGYGNLISLFQAIAIKAVPPHRMGLATATYFTFLDSGIGVGPYLLGFLIPFTGFRGLYLLMAVLIFATIFLYYFLHREKVSLSS